MDHRLARLPGRASSGLVHAGARLIPSAPRETAQVGRSTPAATMKRWSATTWRAGVLCRSPRASGGFRPGRRPDPGSSRYVARNCDVSTRSARSPCCAARLITPDPRVLRGRRRALSSSSAGSCGRHPAVLELIRVAADLQDFCEARGSVPHPASASTSRSAGCPSRSWWSRAPRHSRSPAMFRCSPTTELIPRVRESEEFDQAIFDQAINVTWQTEAAWRSCRSSDAIGIPRRSATSTYAAS